MRYTILGASIFGVLFAGYLSSTKLLSGACAFNESCPYFAGYPACYTGFILYALLAGIASLLFRKASLPRVYGALSAVSFVGVLFSGYFVVQELPVFMARGLSAYLLGLPTCALGLVCFMVILICSSISLLRVCAKCEHHTGVTRG